MKRNFLLLLMLALTLSSFVFGQDEETENARKQRWSKFTKQNWQKIDFKKKKLTKVQLGKLDKDDLKDYGVVSELELLRGVVFGKNGRVFKERPIQDYLEKQVWYKPKGDFSNDVLTNIERDNLDLIRLADAANHSTIQPGDMRLWENKLITEDNLGSYTSAELRVLIGEIEAIHGRTFADEQWLQKYFDERYWYKANANYSPTVLNEIERKNIETLLTEKSKGRNTAIAIGDMDKFQTIALTDDLLNGLTMMELRMIRNEIWARHGRKFDAPGIRQYFEWRDWYKPVKDQSKVKISDIEQQNVNLILAREAKMREKLSTDALDEDALSGLFTEDLRILRNEIFARHGRVFKDAELQKYFAAQAWYQPNPEFKDDQLTETEVKNLGAIRLAEESAISKLAEVEG